MTFPIDKRLAEVLWFPAPDVIPQLCHTVSDVPWDVWNSTEDLRPAKYEFGDMPMPPVAIPGETELI